MPLEQIRPSIHLFRAEKGAVDTYSLRQTPRSEYDQDDDDDGETAAERYEPIQRSSRPENMNLLKLGGVGGVTRSGSWGRNQTASRTEGPFDGSLIESPEQDDSAVLPSVEEDSGQNRIVRAKSIGSHEHQQVKNINMDHFRSCSSDVPSSSSRTSTSSYSAAAFSLRSLSNRNSVSSTTSSGASSSRSPTAASDDESTATNTSNRGSQDISSIPSTDISSILGLKSSLTSPQDTTPRSGRSVERVGPESDRDHSRGIRETNSLDIDDAGDGETTVLQDKEEEDEQVQLVFSTPRGGKREKMRSASANKSLPSSPKKLSHRLSGLTLSAAAASSATASSPTTKTNFIPAAPRRHTGAFTLRSQSALSQSLGGYGAFSGGGGGRAAAREMAKNPDSQENAPFSELEARRAMTQSSPPKRSPITIVSQLPSPQYLRAIPDTSINSGALNSGSTINADRTPTTSMTFLTSMGQAHSPISPSPSTSMAPFRFPPSPKAPESSSLPSHVDGFTRYSPSPIDVDAANATMTAPTSSSTSNRDAGLGSGAEVAPAKSTRPSLTHSMSGSLSSTNVLRTPTTEEWSRFLAKQGLDPAIVAANNAAGRARTSTGRSTSSLRRHNTDRLATLNLTPAAISDFAVAAAAVTAQKNEQFSGGERRGSAVSLQISSDDDDYSSEEEVILESLRQMGLSRSGPNNASSLLGVEDLSMLHEDFEGDEGSDVGEEGEDSSSDERMQALHEAISRPPSRLGSPLLMEASLPDIGESSQGSQIESVSRRMQPMAMRPSRDLAAVVMGYPLPPPGERRKIDDFVILSDIGRGAYGLVKRVQLKDEMTGQGVGREFCIKYIIKSRILADCWRRHKMLGPIPIEIHVMDQLRRLPYKSPSQLPPWSVEQLLDLNVPSTDSVGHPSLCKMLDFFEDHEFYYMVMPCFGKGQDLFDHVESQPHGLSSLQVRCIFGQIADGLRFLHLNNIVHRDVKDENVILDGKGHVQIIDFGSAAHVNKNGRLFDTFSGTLDYDAAEILKGEKYGGKEQDVWALGVVGYVLLCGDCPFWNGEEAIRGLAAESRASVVLQDRCRLLKSPLEGGGQDDGSPVLLDEEIEKRESDLLGQVDGGGRIEDAADLIQCCLELDASMRPTMEQICQHRFLIGRSGWHGRAGWRTTTV